MLNMSDKEREFLTSVGAIATDEHGNEALVGLTPAESAFFLRIQDDLALHKLRTAADLQLYRRLTEKHLVARRIALRAPGD